MILLPLSEWRLIEYHFFGPRSFSVFHILFAIFVALLLPDLRRCLVFWKQHLNDLVIVFYPLVLALVALVVVPPSSKFLSVESLLMSVFITIMTTTGLLLMSWAGFTSSLFRYLCAMGLLLTFPVLALSTPLFPWWHQLFLPMGYAHFFSAPFRQPNQAAFFVLASMFLLLGLLLSGLRNACLRSTWVVVVVVAITELAIALSGSRTGAGLLAGPLTIFLSGYLLWWFRNRPNAGQRLLVPPRFLVAGIILGAILIAINYDKPGVRRTASMLGYSMYDLLTAHADLARHALWAAYVPWLQGSEWAYGADEGFDATSFVAAGGSLHSVILDFYVFGSPFAAIFYCMFLLALLGLVARKAYMSWDTSLFPMYWSSVMVTLEIVAYMVYQPVEYFVPIWVAIGVVLSTLFLQPLDVDKVPAQRQHVANAQA